MDYLGENYYCIASNGHIRFIEGLKSIDTKDTFIPKFSIIEEKQSHINTMRVIISKFLPENILLATDDDREGEAISWHICEVFGLPISSSKRILFHEITKPALIDAVSSPTKINMNLVYAQHARQVLDMVVGYKVSPFLWKYLYHNNKNALSAGRCQTPALRLVYDNEKEGQNSGVEYKYKTIGNFTSQNIFLELNREFENQEEVVDFLEKNKRFSHMLSLGSPKESKSMPPKPFNTSRLLQTASNLFHMSPKETMGLCQILYQNGFITYMRTDSVKYSGTFLEKMRTFIKKHWKREDFVGNLQVLENLDDTNPHEAIHVTDLDVADIPDNENKRLMSLYRLIWRNSVESCMAEYRYNNISVKISAPDDLYFQYNLEIPISLGWKVVNEKKTGEIENALFMYLKSLELSKAPVAYNNIDSNVVVRNKHTHYTEATLIQKLESQGIGRPSTFASLIDTIQERGYVKKMDLEGDKIKCSEYKLFANVLEKIEKERVFGNERGKLVIQPVGILTLEFLLEHFEKLFAYDYTKNMEEQLDQISSGLNPEWAQLCRDCYKEIKALSKPVANLEKQVYPLDDKHDFVFDKYGPVIRSNLDDGTVEFISVNKDMKIDLEKLKAGEYSVDDLIEIKNNVLGQYNGEDVFLKTGKYGAYIQVGEMTKSIKKPIGEIVLADAIALLDGNKSEDQNVLRVLTPYMSVRRGKFGAYVYYMKPGMKKPSFLNIKKFPGGGFITCDAQVLIDWLNTTYHLE